MRQRPAFTFIETMIVVAIVAILGAIVYPMMLDLGDQGDARVMQATVRQIRQKIALHAALGDVPMSREGFPMDIHAEWFASNDVPLHSWTGRPLKIKIVNGPKTSSEPHHHSYIVAADDDSIGANAWYNASNGAFYAIVPRVGDDAEVRNLFELVNLHPDEGEGDGSGAGEGSG